MTTAQLQAKLDQIRAANAARKVQLDYTRERIAIKRAFLVSITK